MRDAGHMTWAVLGIIIAGIIFEWLKYHRESLFANAKQKTVDLNKCSNLPAPK